MLILYQRNSNGQWIILRWEGANKSWGGLRACVSLSVPPIRGRVALRPHLPLSKCITPLRQDKRAMEMDTVLSEDLFAARHCENKWWPVCLWSMAPSQRPPCCHVGFTAIEWWIAIRWSRLSYSPSRQKTSTSSSLWGFYSLSKQILPENPSRHGGTIQVSIITLCYPIKSQLLIFVLFIPPQIYMHLTPLYYCECYTPGHLNW